MIGEQVRGTVVAEDDTGDGYAVGPVREPNLTRLVSRVAERLGLRETPGFHIVAEPVAVAVPGRGRAVLVHVGYSLVRRLPEAELAAVVARELALHRRTADRPTTALLRARAVVVASMGSRLRAPDALLVRLLEVGRARIAVRALAADADAAAVAGTEAVRAALTRSRIVDMAHHLVGEPWLELLGEEGAYPEDFYEALDAALDDPHTARRMAAEAESFDDPMGLAIEPPMQARIAALPEHPGAGWDPVRPVILHDPGPVRQHCLRDLTERGLRPVRVLDGVPDQTDRDAATLTGATGQDSVRLAVLSLLDAIGDGSWLPAARRLSPGVARLPGPMRDSAARDDLIDCLARVLAATLLSRGWSRANRWTPTLVADPTGAPLDLDDLVRRSIAHADPGRLRALIA